MTQSCELETSQTQSKSKAQNFYLVPPWKHQQEAAEKALHHDDFALFFEQGTGKTATAINFYRHKCVEMGKFLSCLILCPPIVIHQWKREFDNHSKLGEKVVCLTGSGKERIETLKKRWNDGCVFITNYDALLMKELYKLFVDAKFEFLICDESHKLKNPQAKRSKLAEELADRARFRLILTGTPILNSPIDIYQQFRILDGGKTFGRNFWAFRATYFYDKNAGMPRDRYFPDWRPRPQTFQQLNNMIYKKAMRILKTECLDLPPLVRQDLFVELGKEQGKHYKEMQKEFITFLGDQACTAQLAITKSLRLQQILSGFIKLEDDSTVVFEDNPRLEALREQIEEIAPQHKIIVWATFKENYKMIAKVCDELGVKYTELHGLISANQREENIKSFRNDPEVRVLIANPQAGGVGVNLVEASYSIWYSRSFRLEDDLQAEARNHRGGSEVHEKITRIDLVAGETMDELILDALKQKQNIADVILKWKIQLALF